MFIYIICMITQKVNYLLIALMILAEWTASVANWFSFQVPYSGAYMSQKIDELCTSGRKHENLYTGVFEYADFKF